jgi:UDP-glucose 4-epimerase
VATQDNKAIMGFEGGSSALETVLVTGGAGFIGSHLVDAYVDRGHRVVVIDDLSTGREENVNPKAEFHRLGLLDERLSDVFADAKPTVVNHHAAQASVRRSVEDPTFDAQVNVIGSLRLLELARANGTRKVLFASTGGAIYGEQDYFPADEKHPQRPVSPYGAAKAAVEIYLGYYAAQYGLAYTALRYANVYGPRQDPHGEAGVVAIFSQQLIAGERPTINGDGLQTRDFVFVEDVVAANVAATGSEFTGAVNIGTGVETSVLALLGLIKAVSGASVEPQFGPAKPGEQQRSVLVAETAAVKLGWRPRVGLVEGLGKTVDFFRGRHAGQASR